MVLFEKTDIGDVKPTNLAIGLAVGAAAGVAIIGGRYYMKNRSKSTSAQCPEKANEKISMDQPPETTKAIRISMKQSVENAKSRESKAPMEKPVTSEQIGDRHVTWADPEEDQNQNTPAANIDRPVNLESRNGNPVKTALNPRLTPSVYPTFTQAGADRTLMSRMLELDLYNQLSELKTNFDSKLDDCIQIGVDCPEGDPDSHARMSCGFVGCDFECYALFEPLFMPIIHMYHAESYQQPHVGFYGWSVLPDIEVHMHRNLSAFPFAPRISRHQRRQLCNPLLQMAFTAIPEPQQSLVAPPNVTFDAMNIRPFNSYMSGAGQYRDLLDARAMVRGDAEAIYINRLDHVEFVGYDSNGDFSKALDIANTLAGEGENSLKEVGLEFAKNDVGGFLTVFPEMVGLGCSVKFRMAIAIDTQIDDEFIFGMLRYIGNAGLHVFEFYPSHEDGTNAYYDVEAVGKFIRRNNRFDENATLHEFLTSLDKLQSRMQNRRLEETENQP